MTCSSLGAGEDRPVSFLLFNRTMSGDLATTNLLLSILAAVSVLEALLIVGTGIAVLFDVPEGEGPFQQD